MYREIALVELVHSPFNARHSFDSQKMAELVASVKEKGILSPILVRAVPGGKFEVVCGARRLKAAVECKLEKMPCVVKELTDQQALECQVIENLQREDVHPLEEAEGYEQLLKKYGYKTVDDIAVKVGKSRAYVYGRLKLCDLLPENRKLFYDGKISPSGALFLARVPAHFQKKAGVEIIRGEDDFPVPLSDVRRYIERNLMMELKEAQFNTKEKDLAGKVSCVECPKRTGNQPDLFADVQGKDVCTDPACFDAKKGAFASRLVAELRKQGHRVVSDAEAKQLFHYENDDTPNEKFMAAGDRKYDWPSGVTVGSMLMKAKDIKPVYAVQPFSGKVIKMVDRKDLPALMKAAGMKVRNDESKSPDLAAQKKFNRVEETRQRFWREKLTGMKDRRCLNAMLLFIVLREMSYGEDDEFLKGAISGEWDAPKLYALGDAKVKELLDKAAVRRPQQMDVDDGDLEFLCRTIGFTIAKDYVITKEYLDSCTKDELAKLAKEIGLVKALEKKNIDCSNMGTMKKTELIDVIMKSDLRASVPKELAK